jgi:hypothetical protein
VGEDVVLDRDVAVSLSKVKFLPLTSAPFSSVTLPIRPLRKVTLSPLLWNASVFAKPASTSRPLKVTPLAALSSVRSFAPGSPVKWIGRMPAGTACPG